VIEIPVVYGGRYGPDMTTIKKTSGLSYSEIIYNIPGMILLAPMCLRALSV